MSTHLLALKQYTAAELLGVATNRVFFAALMALPGVDMGAEAGQ